MPLRIVFDARKIRDFGVGTYIRNLLSSLGRADSEDRFFVIIEPGDAGELPQLPPNFHVATYESSQQPVLGVLSYPAFLRRFRGDLYHIPTNVVPFFMPRPYVVTVHDMSSLLFQGRQDLRQDWRLYRFRRGLERASAVISVSQATRSDVQHTLGIPVSRTRLIYNAPDPVFTAPARGLELDETYHTMERYQINYPFILYAGNIRPQKNIPRLVEAFAVLRGELKRHPIYSDLRLIIIGDEISKYPAVRQAVIRTRVEQAVRFLGFVPIHTLRMFYKAAAIFAFPSLYEGFGLPPLEAMACGTPVVCSNVSSLPEVVGDAAVLVNPENVFDIARGLREVLLDEKLRQQCVVRGYEQLRHFSWDRAAERVLQTYREVASAGRKAGDVEAA
jgi:glycosyltransferase involved in cell wall biosynthesis